MSTAKISNRNYPRYFTSGALTDSYTSILTTDIAEKATLVIKNTSSVGLYIKVYIIADRDNPDLYNEWLSETEIAAGALETIAIGQILADNIIVYAKNKIAGSTASYSISAITKKLQ